MDMKILIPCIFAGIGSSMPFRTRYVTMMMEMTMHPLNVDLNVPYYPSLGYFTLGR